MRGEEALYRGREGGGCSKEKAHWEKLGVPSSHWLNCDGLSLAGLLLRQAETLPSSCWERAQLQQPEL